MKLVYAAAPVALFLAACATDAPETEILDAMPAEETVEEAVEVAEAAAEEDMPALCEGFGPQTPRDIASKVGLNMDDFPMAGSTTKMNLCNIHTHTNAEHKGPGFSVFVDATDSGGYACNGTTDLTAAELEPSEGAYEGVVPGDTIEVHWVHTSCPATPGEGLGSCVPEGCDNPVLRVETQVFLVVNDESAMNFMDMAYQGNVVDGYHQPKMIPASTGEPVVFRGSTTGPSYTQAVCSPVKATWSVRPQCAKLDIDSLHAWAESGNVFNETKSHGVRQLVTAPELLSPIE
ncbi:MAG: delta-class carbonic anhydrase [Pseudomonadota bacterium]